MHARSIDPSWAALSFRGSPAWRSRASWTLLPLLQLQAKERLHPNRRAMSDENVQKEEALCM
jgi:hypothetical protein